MLEEHWDIEDMPSQRGKIDLVTGANSGLGFEITRALARKEARVVMACRSEIRGKQALKRITDQVPEAKLELMLLDLSSLDEVKKFSQTFKERYDKLHLLFNNAGVMIPPYQKTKDGFELQFGVNHLAHFALTGQLMPLLKNTTNARVVTTSSRASMRGQIHFEDFNFKNGYNDWKAYGQSKLANLMFGMELNGLERKVSQCKVLLPIQVFRKPTFSLLAKRKCQSFFFGSFGTS